MDTSLLKVFVYGTLKPGGRYYQHYCVGRITQADPAIAIGQLYHFPRVGYPAMVEGHNTVHGYVLHLADPSLLRELDILEGYTPGIRSGTTTYDRRRIQTYRPSGQPLTIAWVYQMQVEQIQRFGGVLVPSGNWVS